MPHILSDAAPRAACSPTATDYLARADALLGAAVRLLALLETGQKIESSDLREAMAAAFGGSDAQGAWDWKSAYDACEVAQILFLRRYGAAMMSRRSSAACMLSLIERVAALLPTHTRRSEAGQALQQFSTPAGLAYVATIAASLQPGEALLEPSAGTGMLAIHAELAGASLLLNEIGAGRAALLGRLFPDCPVTQHDAAAIDDRLHPTLRPSVVLMNPPFSALANVSGTIKDAAMRHIRSALARLESGGRLVAITGAGCAPDAPVWHAAFIALQSIARVTFTAAIHGRVYSRHGTTVETRLTVIDKLPATDRAAFPVSPGMAPDTATLLEWVEEQVPPRRPLGPPPSPVDRRAKGTPLAG